MTRLRFGNDRHWIEQISTDNWKTGQRSVNGESWTNLHAALRDELVEAREIIAHIRPGGIFSEYLSKACAFLDRTQIIDPSKSVFPINPPVFPMDPPAIQAFFEKITAALNELSSRLPDKSA